MAGYAAYLDSYPKGKFAALAQAGKQKAERLQTERERQEIEDRRKAQERERLTAEQARREAERQAREMAPGKVFRDCADCPEMVVIPAGSFDMGETGQTHRVSIRSFALGKTEVTQAQWQAVMGSNPTRFKGCGLDCPVENVSWDDIQEFIRRLNSRSGKQYRLPSEGEWEYACRAGSRDEYCGGNDLIDLGWYDNNSQRSTHAAAQKRPNAFGLFDMSGNVWEWTQDCWNDNYGGAPSDGSARTSGDCAKRVVRGGSWGINPRLARSALRSRLTTSYRNNFTGFRLARTLSP